MCMRVRNWSSNASRALSHNRPDRRLGGNRRRRHGCWRNNLWCLTRLRNNPARLGHRSGGYHWSSLGSRRSGGNCRTRWRCHNRRYCCRLVKGWSMGGTLSLFLARLNCAQNIAGL
jgi:hypothetical protein